MLICTMYRISRSGVRGADNASLVPASVTRSRSLIRRRVASRRVGTAEPFPHGARRRPPPFIALM